MRRRSVACIALVMLMCGFARSADDPSGPAKDIPELKVLSQYAGNWDGEMTVKPNPNQPKGAQTTGPAVGEWIHDGRFLRQTWSSKASGAFPAMNGSTIMTYDPHKKTYRSWSFNSGGQMGESQGTWDAKTRTLTWTMRDDGGGGASVTKATFPEIGIESWSIIVKDRDGQVVADLSGKNTRRKK